MACALLLMGCGGGKGSQTDGVDSLTAEVDSLAADEDFVPLNEIRFANFTDEDWLDNGYYRELRRYLDDVRQGREQDEELEEHKALLGTPFVVLYAEEHRMGGLQFYFAFAKKPTVWFCAWVYSDVDVDEKKVVGYDTRSVFEVECQMTEKEFKEAFLKDPNIKKF